MDKNMGREPGEVLAQYILSNHTNAGPIVWMGPAEQKQVIEMARYTRDHYADQRQGKPSAVRQAAINMLPLLAASGERMLRKYVNKPDADLEDKPGVLAYKAIEELAEMMRASHSKERMRDEFGDVMAYLAALASRLGVYEGN